MFWGSDAWRIVDLRTGAETRNWGQHETAAWSERMAWHVAKQGVVRDLVTGERLTALPGVPGWESVRLTATQAPAGPVAVLCKERYFGRQRWLGFRSCTVLDRNGASLCHWYCANWTATGGTPQHEVFAAEYLSRPQLLLTSALRFSGVQASSTYLEAHDVSPGRQRLRMALACGPLALWLAWIVGGVWRRRSPKPTP